MGQNKWKNKLWTLDSTFTPTCEMLSRMDALPRKTPTNSNGTLHRTKRQEIVFVNLVLEKQGEAARLPVSGRGMVIRGSEQLC